VPGDLTTYRVFLFGIPTIAFPHASLIGHLIFHGLVWSSFLVIAGVLLALHRRLRDHGPPPSRTSERTSCRCSALRASASPGSC
jgi:hypothetical protein